MAERGQITGGLLDGPLALDNAIDLGAARIKKISSAVAGMADILVVPDLEAGNMLAKSLSFMAQADAAGEDHFRYGRHADQCGTKQFGGADFGGGFEARAGEPVIDAFGKGDTGFRGGGS